MKEGSIKERTIEFVKSKGITMKSFENQCGLSSGYVTSMRKGYGSDKLSNVLKAYPELNRDWLLYGEGEMLRSSYSQNIDEGTNFTQTGNVTVNSTSETVLMKFLDELTAQRKITEKAQEQIDNLIAIIAKMHE